MKHAQTIEKVNKHLKNQSGDISQPDGPVEIFQLGKNLMKCQQIIARKKSFHINGGTQRSIRVKLYSGTPSS